MNLFLSITVFLVLHQSISGQSMLDKCSTQAARGNTLTGYFSHDTDCDKFIQCQYNTAGILEGEIRQCAFSTYWNNDLLTCMPATEMNCPTDNCQRQLNGMREKAEGNCRGYWECVDGKSVAMCCPQGQFYNGTYGCVDNEETDECVDTCFNDIPIAVPENETVVVPCEMQAVAGKPSMYKLEIPGFPRPFVMSCPAGTAFNQTMCECSDAVTIQIQAPQCKPEISLTFDMDERDESGNNNHVQNENVIIENGTAYFNGIDSQLIIPRFNNIERVNTVVIKINYTSNHNKSGIARAIISNSGDCSTIPSVLLTEDANNVYFGVGTTSRPFVYAYLPHDNVTGESTNKTIVYKYDGLTLSGTNGVNRTEEAISGYLRNVHCPINVGYAKDLAPFEGEIHGLEIYLCDPDM